MALRGSVKLVGLGDFQGQFDWAHHRHIALNEVLNRCYLQLVFFLFTAELLSLLLFFLVSFGSLVRQVKVGQRLVVVCCAHFFVIDSVCVEGCGALIVPAGRHLVLLLLLLVVLVVGGGVLGGKEELVLVLFGRTAITGLVGGEGLRLLHIYRAHVDILVLKLVLLPIDGNNDLLLRLLLTLLLFLNLGLLSFGDLWHRLGVIGGAILQAILLDDRGVHGR